MLGNESSHTLDGLTVLGGLNVLGELSVNGVDAFWETVDVSRFGAVGDGVHDDTAAIQAAIDATPASGIRRGGLVYFPPGQYKITAALSVVNRPAVCLAGPMSGSYVPSGSNSTFAIGATLVLSTNSQVGIDVGDNVTLQHQGPVIQGLSLCAGIGVTGTTGIRVRGVNRGTLRNVGIFKCATGFSLQQGSLDASWWMVDQCSVDSCTTGIDADSSGFVVVGGEFTNNSSIGIKCAGASSRIIGAKFDVPGTAIGVHIIGYGSQIVASNMEGATTGSHVKIDGTGAGASGRSNSVIAVNTVGSGGTGIGIEITALASDSNVYGHYASNLATTLSDAGLRTTYQRAGKTTMNGTAAAETVLEMARAGVVYGAWSTVGGGVQLDLAGGTTNGNLLVQLGDALNCSFKVRDSAGAAKFEVFGDGHARFNGGPHVWTGTGSPETVKTAPVGSLFLRTDGGANTTLYVKESGAAATGWIAK